MYVVGNRIGAGVRATIEKYNGDGTIEVKTDHTGVNSQDYKSLMMPAAFVSPDGAFIGGCPEKGTPVLISQQQGEWIASQYIRPDNIYTSNLLDEFKPGRLLIQTKNASNRILLDPKQGISIGTTKNSLFIDTNSKNKESFTKNIISHNVNKELSFTLSGRKINGTIARDINYNAGRNIFCSMLDDTNYEDSLIEIGFDTSKHVSLTTNGYKTRNLPFVENREIVYEFANTDILKYTTDKNEADHYQTKSNKPLELWDGKVIKNDSRAYTLGLSLDYPNHLMEEVKGTVVDAFGNILDLNRDILPIGKDKASFLNNSDLKDAFQKIRSLHRKSIAYHFEINARKTQNENEVYPGADVNKKTDFARERSRFFIDIDKEGQIKANIPASSETGNIPLLTRYENASNIAFADGQIQDPNLFIFEENENRDIYHDSFARYSKVNVVDSSENATTPIDRIDNTKIKYGTAFHDITKAGYQFTTERLTRDTGGLLFRYMPNFGLNQRQNSIQLDKIVSDTIYTSGEKANAGGRSGSINMDGFLALNVGANTVDRQSLWLDTAGGVVSTLGKDLRGVSYCATLDGDMLVQIGAAAAVPDSRFASFTSENAAKSGAMDIRVIKSDGQMTVVRIDEQGVSIATYGRCEIASQQDLILRSNTNIMFEAPNVIFYPENGMARVVQSNGVKEI